MLQHFPRSKSQGFPLSVKLLGEADMPRRCDRAWEASVAAGQGPGAAALVSPQALRGMVWLWVRSSWERTRKPKVKVMVCLFPGASGAALWECTEKPSL